MGGFSFFDLIFPKKCLGCGSIGSYICNNCFSKIKFVEFPICPVCQRQAVGGKTHPICLGSYALDGLIVGAHFKGVVRKAILNIKYKWSYDICNTLAEVLAQNLWRFSYVTKASMVPIPLHRTRKRWRGFNQAEVIARVLSRRFGQNRVDLLEKVVPTKTQVGLKKEERIKNIKGAFRIGIGVDPESIKDRDFILVDDVFTSGATTSEACKVLKKAGARSVWAMTMALG